MAKKNKKNMPIGKNEDVEFSKELADKEDMEAVRRAKAADQRQTKEKE